MALTDIHSHILFGVDDGAKSEAIMFDMLDKAYENGVRFLCATPHYNPELFRSNPEKEAEAFENLCEYATARYPDLKLFKGNEVFVFSRIPSIVKESKRVSLAGKEHVLIEFSSNVTFREMMDTVSSLNALGYTAVLAHIERYYKIKENDIMELKLNGALITVNAESVVGKNGIRKRFFVRRLIKYGLVNIVSSDAHSPVTYKYFSEAYKCILKKYGKDVAESLFYETAQKTLI